MPSSRHGTLFMSRRMPTPPLLAISTDEDVSPAAPMSWMATIAADAGDHARDQVSRLRVIGPAEAQSVEVRHRSRAHGEHVAQDSADTRRRALIGLNVGGVVVALHLEDRRVAVANVDHARIFAR